MEYAAWKDRVNKRQKVPAPALPHHDHRSGQVSGYEAGSLSGRMVALMRRMICSHLPSQRGVRVHKSLFTVDLFQSSRPCACGMEGMKIFHA